MAPLSTKSVMTLKSSALLLMGIVVLSGYASVAQADVSTGVSGVCCAFIPRSAGGFTFACNQPSRVPGSVAFPSGTIISGINLVPGQIAQCVGRFPFPAPSGFSYTRVPQLFSTPNGAKCAGQFPRFYQGLGPDGGFVVQCTN